MQNDTCNRIRNVCFFVCFDVGTLPCDAMMYKACSVIFGVVKLS